MRLLPTLIAFALVSLPLAGCIGKDDNTEKGGSDVTPGAVKTPTNTPPTVKKTPPKTPIALTVSQDLYWVKPGTAVTFDAASPAASDKPLKYRWQYGPPLPTAAPAAEDGGHAHGGHGGAAGGAVKTFDTGDIAPGATSTIKVTEENYYFFHCHPHPWMKFNLTVAKDATLRGVQHVAILDGKTKGDMRYFPEELTVAPGTTLMFHNNGTAVHTVTEEARVGLLKTIPGDGPQVTFNFLEAGEFRIVTTVMDGANGEGKTETRLLVDENTPSDTYTAQFKDDFTLVAGPSGTLIQGNTASHPFKIDYDGALTGALTVTSDTPVPPSVNVYLFRAGESSPLAKIEAADATGALDVPTLPAGDYSIFVEVTQGAEAHTLVDIVVKMLLKPPVPGAEDDHGGHGGAGHDH